MTSYVSKAKRPAIAATEYRAPGRQERMVGANGEVNASNKADLLRNSMHLAQAAGAGHVFMESAGLKPADQSKVNKELLTAAFADANAHRVLGERMAEEIYMTNNRKGFSRRFLNRIELKQGDIPRFPVRLKNVTASYATGPTKLETQLTHDKYLMPPEFGIQTRIFVPQNDINQSNTDVLEEKYVEALEAIMVAEDRLWYNMVQALVGVDNNKQIISGSLTVTSLMNARLGVTSWGLKAPYCLLAADLFTDIAGDNSFIQAIEPVARHELVMTGEMAILYGMTLITEAYRHPEHKVLSAGELIVVSDAQTHGAYSDRNGVDSAPLDATTERIMGRGWLLSESVSMAIANSRSVQTAVRV